VRLADTCLFSFFILFYFWVFSRGRPHAGLALREAGSRLRDQSQVDLQEIWIGGMVAWGEIYRKK